MDRARKLLGTVWTAIQPIPSSDDESEDSTDTMSPLEIEYMEAVLKGSSPPGWLVAGAKNLLLDLDSDPEAYTTTAEHMKMDIEQAEAILTKARAFNHSAADVLEAIIREAVDIVPLLGNRFKFWNENVDSRAYAYLERYEIREPAEEDLTMESSEDFTKLCTLKLAIAVQKRLSEQLGPIEDEYINVQIFDSEIERRFQQGETLMNELRAEIEEEQTLNNSIDKISGEVTRIERQLGWVPGVEQRQLDWAPEMENLKTSHGYKVPRLVAQLELLEHKSRAAENAPRKFVERDTTLIDYYGPRLMNCKRELADIFKNEEESDMAVIAISVQLRKIARETPLGFLPIGKIDELEKQLRDSGTVGAWVQIGEIEQLRKRHEEAKNINRDRFESEFLPEKLIGVGGFGCVIKAKHLMDMRAYALKRITLKPSKELNTKALDEVLRMAKLNHAGIVRYHNAWIEQSSESQNKHFKQIDGFELLNNTNLRDNSLFLFIQMELCKESLSEWLNRNMGPRKHSQMVSWFEQIMNALQYIHSENMFHRDLKPMNILVVSEMIVKICDLGIAADCIIEDDSMPWRTEIGTQMYKAPEQCSFYDEKVDIYSSGLILLEMCAVMSEIQKIEVRPKHVPLKKFQIFNELRCGKAVKILEVLNSQNATFDLITKLTSLNKDLRPGFEEIHNHRFFAEDLSA